MIINDELMKRYFLIFSIVVFVQKIETLNFCEESFSFFTDYKLTNNDPILINDVRSAQACGSICLTTSNCCAVSYISNTRECYLDTSGTCSSPKVPFVGAMAMIRQPVLPKDCEDVTDGNGQYMINPSTCSGPSNDFNVYCEEGSDDQYWTVFQRRVDGLTDFYRTWLEYEKGFGDLTNEFWLGNEKVHMLTSNNNYTLRIELEDFANEKRYAEYQSFKISDAQSNYQLLINGYSGDAGDSLDYHNGMPFSTKDRDNDPSPNVCAVKFHGAWWYNYCHQSNLNGNYLSGAHTSFADGMEWIAWTGYQYSLKSSKMMIRRQNGN